MLKEFLHFGFYLLCKSDSESFAQSVRCTVVRSQIESRLKNSSKENNKSWLDSQTILKAPSEVTEHQLQQAPVPSLLQGVKYHEKRQQSIFLKVML